MSLRYGGVESTIGDSSSNRDTTVSGEGSSAVGVASRLSGSPGKISSLISESQSLQAEINNLFGELAAVNREIRIDVDDFCDMCDSSLANISTASNS